MKLNINYRAANYAAFRVLIGIVLILFLNYCKKDKNDPALETTSITALSASSYTVSAKITDRGDYKILDHGFVYSVGSSFESGYIYNNKVSLGSTIDNDIFSTTIKLGDLQYYYGNDLKVFAKAYITNERGTMYAKEVSTQLLKLVITQITPSTAKTGDTLTLNGVGFSPVVSENIVKFNSVDAKVIAAASGYLKAIVPAGISYSYWGNTVSVYVSSGGQVYQLDNAFTMAASPVSFSPSSGSWNTYITVQGSGLYNAKLYFDDVEVTSNNYSSDYISAYVPTSLLKKKFKIFVGSGSIKTEVPGGYFSMDKLIVSPLTDLIYYPGSQIYFGATGINPTLNYNILFLGSTIVSANNGYSNLSFTIPATMAEGYYPVKLSNGIDTVSLGQTISLIKPIITGISPSSGYPDDVLKISGQNLFATTQNSYVYFNSVSQYPVSADSDQISLKVPWLTAGEYTLTVYVNWLGSLSLTCPQKFTVLEPKVTSISPSTGAAGSSVIIKGEGFGITNGISVYFGNLYAPVLSSTGTQINVQVPAGITKGEWIVKVLINYNQLSSSVTFIVP